MQNFDIIKQMADYIMDTAKCNKSNAMCMLLGNCEGFQDNRYLTLSSLSKPISKKKIKSLRNDWRWRPLEKALLQGQSAKEFESKISELYSKYLNDCDINKPIENKIRDLVYLSIFGTIHLENMFERYTGRVCENYVEDLEIIYAIDRELEMGNILVLSGMGGIGKTQLVRNYIKKHKDKYTDVGWGDEDYCQMDIKDQIENLPFIFKSEGSQVDGLRAIKEKGSNSLIIINRPALSDSEYLFIEKELLGLEVRMIITTRVHSQLDVLQSINIKTLSHEVLYEIFHRNLEEKNRNVLNHTQFLQLLNIIGNNTMAVSLIARSYNDSEHSIPVDAMLDPQGWIWGLSNLKLIHAGANYFKKDEGHSVIYHICNIFNKYESLEKYKELAVWAKRPVSIEALEQWCEHGIKEVIQDAIKKGFLEYVDAEENYIQMHQLISDAIWKQYPIKYSDYNERIEEFIRVFQTGKFRPNKLYDISMDMIFRFHISIITRDRGYRKKQYNKWQQNLKLLLQINKDYGNSIASADIVRMLYKNYEKNSKYINQNEDITVEQKIEICIYNMEIRWMNGENILVLLDEAEEEVRSFEVKDQAKICLDPRFKLIQLFVDYITRRVKGQLDKERYSRMLEVMLVLVSKIECRSSKDASKWHTLYNGIYYFMLIEFSIISKKEEAYNSVLWQEAYECLEKLRRDNSISPELKFRTIMEAFYWKLTIKNRLGILCLHNDNTWIEELKSITAIYKTRSWPWQLEFLYYVIHTEYYVISSAQEQNDLIEASTYWQSIGEMSKTQFRTYDDTHSKQVDNMVKELNLWAQNSKIEKNN